MGNKASYTLMHWLLDPHLSDSEFKDLELLLLSPDLMIVIAQAKDLRGGSYSTPISLTRGHHKTTKDDTSDVSQRVESLLRGEAGMTTAAALEKLYEKLGVMHRERSRRSFKDEVRMLEDVVGGSRLLSIAQQIRNEILHRTNDDWPLRSNQP